MSAQNSRKQKHSPLATAISTLSIIALGVAVLSIPPSTPASSPRTGFQVQKPVKNLPESNNNHDFDVKNSSNSSIQTTPYLSKTPAKSAPQKQALQLAPGKNFINYPYTALMTPNDPLFTSQWNLSRESLPKLWDTSTGSSNITIAVIDTGVALSHQDLAGQWRTNPGELGPTNIEGPAPNCTSRGLPLDKSCNNLDNDGNGYASDWRGWDFVNDDNDPSAGTVNPTAASAFHGTYVTGLAAAKGNNQTGIAGVSWGAKIMPLQALDDTGSGFTDSVASAVRYAADNGANVINMSLGSSYDDPYLQQQIDYAESKGVVVVAAAGNNGCDCLSFPANYSEVIAVGASGSDDTRASFSSYGANLDLLAPGMDGICSTMWTSTNQTSAYSCGGQGTSFSSPQVAGAAALLLSKYPGLSPAQVESFLKSGSDKVMAMGGATFSSAYGDGRLDVYSALLQSTEPTNTSKPAGVSLSSLQDVTTVCSIMAPTCGLKLISQDGSQTITIPPQPVNRWGDATIYWSPSSLGLTSGTWTVQFYSGSTVSQGSTTITIDP